MREWGERKGGTGKEGRQGGAVSSVRLSTQSLAHETKGGGREISTLVQG